MLYGNVNIEQLYFDFPAWKEQEKLYIPDSTVIKKLNVLKNKTNVKLFLGTWCIDSRRNVPNFFKTVQNMDSLTVEIWALDRKKEIESNEHELYNIKRVPTFVFEKNGKEIGRIIEYPKTTIEQDILEILNQTK